MTSTKHHNYNPMLNHSMIVLLVLLSTFVSLLTAQTCFGIDMNEVARWEYGSNFNGQLQSNANDAYSWRAGLVDGGSGGLNLNEWVLATYGEGFYVTCDNPSSDACWKVCF